MAKAHISDSTPEIQLDFAHDVSAEQQRVVEHSVESMAAQACDRTARIRAEEAERAEFEATLTQPFMHVIEDNPAAVKTLEDLRTRPLFQNVPTLQPVEEPLVSDDFATLMVRAPIDIKVIPFDFTWNWFNTAGSRPFNRTLDPPNGWVGLDARVGLIAGGASSFVDAHVGFGVVLTTDRPLKATGRSLRKMRYGYAVHAVGVGSNATSEGGVEFTVFDNETLVGFTPRKLWRGRVSAGLGHPDEFATADSEGFDKGPPGMELSWTMLPGHQYTFNVGAWVFADRSSGAGGAAAQSIIDGQILLMSFERI